MSPETSPSVSRRSIVTPFARALSLLRAFTPDDRWLGNRDLADRTGIPASSVARIAATLITLGYLNYHADLRKYRLAAPVLALGDAALTDFDLRKMTQEALRRYADTQEVHLQLTVRDRFDMVVLKTYGANTLCARLASYREGARVNIASSPTGYTLVAALPDIERDYLMDRVRRHAPDDWPQLRRRLCVAMSQIHELGYCTSLETREAGQGIIAAPVLLERHAPMVLACTGDASRFTRTRIQHVLGPKLLAMAREIRKTNMQGQA